MDNALVRIADRCMAGCLISFCFLNGFVLGQFQENNREGGRIPTSVSHSSHAADLLADSAMISEWLVKNEIDSSLIDVDLLAHSLELEYAAKQKAIERDLEEKLTRLTRLYDLKPDQIVKLRLIASSEINTLLREYKQVRMIRELKMIQRMGGQFGHDSKLIGDTVTILLIRGLKEVGEDIPKAEPIYDRLRIGLFEQGSLFSKVLINCLTDDQKRVYDRNSLEYAIGYVTWTTPITAEQRDKLAELIRIQKIVDPVANEDIGLQKFAQVDRDRLEEIFDEVQMAAIDKFRERLTKRRPTGR